MTDLDPHLLPSWLARGNAIGRRSFIESSVGVIAGTIAAQSSSALAQTVTASPVNFFPGFRRQSVQTSETTINVLVGGDGPPVLLLHGYPQTHVEWRKIAPELAKNYTLVIPDLRGYGDSGKPPDRDADSHIAYSKRAMALDQVEVMEKLGFGRFAMVSHDRGARVGHRLALDYPDRLTKLVMMDICPTHYMYKTTDRQFASAYFHWFFLIQPAPFPETLIGNNVDTVLKQFMGRVMPKFIEPDAYAEYRRCFSDPATIHASCEDYRASDSIDLVHDESDIDQKISCPVLVLWGDNGFVGRKYDVLAIWRDRATQVSGKGLPSSHWLAEEVPDETLAEVKRFLAA
jgi:haloacetate dehalogenase